MTAMCTTHLFSPLLLWGVAPLVLLGGCATPLAAIETRLDTQLDAFAALDARLEARIKAIGDDLNVSTKQITNAHAKSGRDLSQAINNINETTTTTGVPWYGMATALLILVTGVVLVRRYGYHRRNWEEKERVRPDIESSIKGVA